MAGVLTDSGSCFTWWKSVAANHQSMEEHPPSMVMVTATSTPEAVPFSFLLPLNENEGVEPVSGSTGKMTACKFIPVEQVAALAAEGTIPANSVPGSTGTISSSTTTTPTTGGAATAVTDQAIDTPKAAAPIAVDEPAAEASAAIAPPAVKTVEMTSPAAGRAMAAWTLGLGAVVAAFVCAHL